MTVQTNKIAEQVARTGDEKIKPVPGWAINKRTSNRPCVRSFSFLSGLCSFARACGLLQIQLPGRHTTPTRFTQGAPAVFAVNPICALCASLPAPMFLEQVSALLRSDSGERPSATAAQPCAAPYRQVMACIAGYDDAVWLVDVTRLA